MKFMVTVGDEFSCNNTSNHESEIIYVDSANNECEETTSSSPDVTIIEDGSHLDKSRTSKQIRKICRNTGKAYITSSGKYIAEKRVTPLTDCRAKCNTRFTLEMQQAIFRDYWQLGSYDKRATYVSSMLTVSDKKSFRPRSYDSDKEKFRMKTYAYELEYQGKRFPTCKGCFLKTLDESEGIIKTVAFKIRESPKGIVWSDMRGKYSPRHRELNECIIPAKSTLPFF